MTTTFCSTSCILEGGKMLISLKLELCPANQIRFGISDLDYVGSVAQPRGATGHLPPPPGPSAIRQALGRECTIQADQGENGNLQL